MPTAIALSAGAACRSDTASPSPGGDGGQRLAETPTFTARVTVLPDQQLLAVDARIEPLTAEAGPLTFDLLPPPESDRPGIQIDRLLINGLPASFQHREGKLTIEGGPRAGPVVLEISYRGQVPTEDLDFVTPDEILLARAWLPYSGQAMHWRLQLTAPADLKLVFPSGTTALDLFHYGTERQRMQSLAVAADHLDRFGMTGGRDQFEHRFEHRAVRFALHAPTDLRARCAALPAAVRSALDSLEPLGPFPHRRYRIVVSSVATGRRAVALPGMMVISADLLDDQMLTAAIAHELAHSWFAGTVRDDSGRWSEALASYVSQWALSPADARQLRWTWMVAYEQISDRRDLPLLGTVAMPRDRGLIEAVFYGKGALILTALETRVGRQRVIAALRHFILTRSNRDASWRDFVASVEHVTDGSTAAWLSAWLTERGGPDLEVSDLKRRRGSVRGQIAIRGGPAELSSIELGILDTGGQVTSVTSMPLSRGRADFHMTLPPSAGWVVVDPNYRLPRKPALDGQPRWIVPLSRRSGSRDRPSR